MAKKTWRINLKDGEHKIELEHGHISGKRKIYLDGKLIEYISHNIFDKGSKHYFIINNHRCVVLIISKFKFSYDLIVDGISVETGLPVKIDSKTITDNSLKLYGAVIGILLMFVVKAIMNLF